MTLFCLLLAGLLATASGVGAFPIDAAWGLDPIWDDGMAEVARYDAHRVVYGKDRSFETLLITVKEDFDASTAVKADPPYDGRRLEPVLKLNMVSRIKTENYPYSYMTSVIVRRGDPLSLVKLAHSSQEWCGTTFKEIVTWDGPPHLVHHSYFDGEADGRVPLDLGPGAILEEQLLLALRAARLEKDRTYRFRLLDSLVTNTLGSPAFSQATARLTGSESVSTPAGTFEVDRIEVGREGAGPLIFWIRQSGRRALVKFESSDGRSLELKEISRYAYWD